MMDKLFDTFNVKNFTTGKHQLIVPQYFRILIITPYIEKWV